MKNKKYFFYLKNISFNNEICKINKKSYNAEY